VLYVKKLVFELRFLGVFSLLDKNTRGTEVVPLNSGLTDE